jgi:hypothetical protein
VKQATAHYTALHHCLHTDGPWLIDEWCHALALRCVALHAARSTLDDNEHGGLSVRVYFPA